MSFLKESISETILEGQRDNKEKPVYRFGNKEMDFGSPEHVKLMKGLLVGLEGLRNCFKPGTANRHVYSAACHRIKKQIEKYSTNND